MTVVRPAIDYGDQARLGVIVPSGNTVAEPQIKAMLPPGVTALFTRLALRGSSDAELAAMTEGVEAAAGLLADARVERIVFHCTAVTTFDPTTGPSIRRRMAASTGRTCLVTSDALAAAFTALRARRIVLLTPYIEAVHRREVAFLRGLGLEVVADAALGLDTNAEMAALPPERIATWARRHADARADAYFLSCTALRSAELIGELECAFDCPVVTSNQAMVWHALRSLQVAGGDAAWGRLMDCG